jgi:hypothetical protein
VGRRRRSWGRWRLLRILEARLAALVLRDPAARLAALARIPAGGSEAPKPAGILLGSLLALLLAACPARGVSELRLNVQVIVPPLQRLDVDPAVLTAPVASVGDLEVGYLEVSPVIVLKVHSNVAWDLAIRSRNPGERAPEEPGSLPLLWASGNDFRALNENWCLLLSGPAGAGGVEARLRIRIPIDCTTGPGLYEPRLEYRLAPAGE